MPSHHRRSSEHSSSEQDAPDRLVWGVSSPEQRNPSLRHQRAESWLKSYPRDAVLLLALGRLCAARELWGKAQSYLEASIAVDPTYSAHLALADLHERLGNAEVARFHRRESLDLALVQLKAVTGGERRIPL